MVGGTPGRATELRLSGQGLTGQIPRELGNLSNLETLEPRGQPVDRRDIPTELGNLVQPARAIRSSDNQFDRVRYRTELARRAANHDLARLGLPNCSELTLRERSEPSRIRLTLS